MKLDNRRVPVEPLRVSRNGKRFDVARFVWLKSFSNFPTV
jgi:hypothetical protein